MSIELRRVRTDDLTERERTDIRDLLWRAFGDDPDDRMTEDDWQHALGGEHVVLVADARPVAHASVVPRDLRVDGRPLRTGYVEAVGVEPREHGRGYGTAVMREVGAIVEAGFELGALGTGAHHFYERLGWERWRGPTAVRLPGGGEQRTPDEDGFILVLRTSRTPRDLDLGATLSCEWRSGDAW